MVHLPFQFPSTPFSSLSPHVLHVICYAPQISETIWYLTLCLTYFSQHNLFQSHPCWYKSCIFILSDGGIILHSVYGPHLPYLFVRWRTSWSFHSLVTVAIAAINIGVQMAFFSLHLYLWGKYPGAQLQGHRAVLFLISWGISTLLSKEAAPTCIPTNSVSGFPFLHIPSNTCCFLSY